MSKRGFPLLALTLIASVLFTVVAHACSDLRSMQTALQAPCDHSSPQNEPRGKSEKDNCDLVRYGMLSLQASYAAPELSKIYSISFQDSGFVVFSLPDSLPLFWRSQAPPFSGLGASPHLSHVVLRI
jgi:hypothetical protein